MTVATKSSRTLQIDGMSGEDCVNKVTGALKGVSNVSTREVKVGTASIEADETGCTAACNAINGVGYKARENKRDEQKNEKPGAPQDGARTDQAGFKAEQKNQPSAQAGAASKPAPGAR